MSNFQNSVSIKREGVSVMSFMSEKVMKKANEFLADHLTENMSEEGGRVRRCTRTREFLRKP